MSSERWSSGECARSSSTRLRTRTISSGSSTGRSRALSPILKELPQQRCRTGFSEPRNDLRPVLAGRLREQPDAIVYRPRFHVLRAVVEPAQPRVGDSAGTQGAGLERHVEVAAVETAGAALLQS